MRSAAVPRTSWRVFGTRRRTSLRTTLASRAHHNRVDRRQRLLRRTSVDGAGEVLTGESNYDQLPAKPRLLRGSARQRGRARLVPARPSAATTSDSFLPARNAGTPPRATALGVVAHGRNRQFRVWCRLSRPTSISRSRCISAMPATFRSGFSTRTWTTSRVRACSRKTCSVCAIPSSGAPGTRSGASFGDLSRRFPERCVMT